MAFKQNSVNLFDLNEWSNQNNGLSLIHKLQEFGIMPNDNKCIRGHCMKLVKDESTIDKYKWMCREKIGGANNKKKKMCNYSLSLRHKTFFYKSHLSLLDICGFVNLWVMNCNFPVIGMQLRLSNKTITDWSSFCREVTYDAMIAKKVKLGGVVHTVEIDESKFGRRKHHRGHRVEGQWVFGGYERETGNCFMIPVEDRSAKTLLAIIEEWIKPGTTIISDCWKAYSTLNDVGYNHLTVNHSIHFKDPETGVHSNTIESTWRHAKVNMSNYCRKKQFYGGYLAKYMFIKRCKYHHLDPTVEFFKHAGVLYNVDNPNPIFNCDGGESGDDDEEDEDDDDENDLSSEDDDAPAFNMF